MSEKNENYWGIRLSAGFCLLCIMVFCILPVSADYWAGISENGQYQVTYTNNGDGSSTIQGAAVGPGGTIENLGNTPSVYGDSDGDYAETGVTQNLILDGPSGWAEVIAKDANENEAHAEVDFTDGHVVVFQHAGPMTLKDSTELYGKTGPDLEPVISGVEAGQCVFSYGTSWIQARSYSFNADGSTAAVSAEATNSENSPNLVGDSDRPDFSMFMVHQGTGAYTLTWEEPEKVYVVDSIRYDDGSSTYAYQCGWIKADTADVTAGSSIPQGFSSRISGSVEDGSMNFDMGTNAGQNVFVRYGLPDPNYETTTSGEIEARGDGTASAISTGPNGQYASVVASFERNYCTRKYIDFDLEASGKIYEDGYYKIKTENEIYRPHGYSGDVTATNSADTEGDSVDFSFWHHNYGGVAGLTSSGGEWAHVWPSKK
jgi:hypothetical protein